MSNSSSTYTLQNPAAIINIDLFDGLKSPPNQIRRVPLHLRNRQARPNVYDPILLSLGPYHHGKPELQYAELFKQRCFDSFISQSDSLSKDKRFYYEKIIKRIDEVRGWYENVEYDDEALAWMILHDACFVIYYMILEFDHEPDKPRPLLEALHCYFGQGTINIVVTDLYKLENQVPFWIVRFLLCLQSEKAGKSNYDALLYTTMRVGEEIWDSKPLSTWTNSIHFLDALHRKLTAVIGVSLSSDKYHARQEDTYRFRSVTNLKAKGIHIMRSQYGPQAISFKSASLYGQLFLPPFFVSIPFFVKYSNLIAYEMFLTAGENFTLSLVNFTKSLIETSNDVKLLREKGIVLNALGCDEEVVKIFKDLDTFGWDGVYDLGEIRYSIERHCSKQANTWMAYLMQTYTEKPWKIIALLATATLLCVTILQTYYTIHTQK